MSQEALKKSAGLDVFKLLITYNFYITLEKHFFLKCLQHFEYNIFIATLKRTTKTRQINRQNWRKECFVRLGDFRSKTP